MKLLVVARHFGCLRNYESAVLALAAQGHTVQLVGLTDDILDGAEVAAGLVARGAGRITTERRTVAATSELVRKLRLAVDYLRYLEPAYAEAPRLRQRAWERTPRGVLGLLRVPGVGSRWGRRVLAVALRRLEAAVPLDTEVAAYLRAVAPDVVMLTPLIGLGAPEQEYYRVAQALGFRTVFGVWSWDNLSSKSVLRSVPSLMTVWNEVQRREAEELHGVPRTRIAVTGAQCFDQWFERQPTRSREAFCARVGLPAERPFVLYVCSALFAGSPSEAAFVRRWVEALRTQPALREVGVLVRPHPSREKEWTQVSLAGLGPVVRWGANPVDSEAKADYYDSLQYTTAVVGLNTSAFLEAAILEKPVLTLLFDEFKENQEGTLHFHYLLGEEGLLTVARDWATHGRHLAEAVTAPVAARSRAFADQFLRPQGREVSSTDQWVTAVETLAATPVPAAATPLSVHTGGGRVWKLCEYAAKLPSVARLLQDPLSFGEIRQREERLLIDRRQKEDLLREREVTRLAREEFRDRRHREATTEKTNEQHRKEAAKQTRIKDKRRLMAQARRQRVQHLVVSRVKRLIGLTSQR